jgi:hypothetical protein
MKSLASARRLKQATLAVVVFCFGVAGFFYLYGAQAASYAIELEPEWSWLRGNSLTVDHATASGGMAVRFGDIGKCVTASPWVFKDEHPESTMAQAPWPRDNPTGEAVIYFQTKGLPAEYAGYVQTAAQEWSDTNCIDARAVVTCPLSSNCVDMHMIEDAPTNTVFGTSWLYFDDSGWYTMSSKIELYGSTLRQASTHTRRVLVKHELGHSLGLAHRGTEDVVMYPVLRDESRQAHDDIDRHNILALYGQIDVLADSLARPAANQPEPPAMTPSEYQRTVPEDRIERVAD